MGQRAGDGARRAGRIAVSVPPARDAERESRAARGDAGARLDRRRPGLARQGDEPAADGLEPPAPGDPAALDRPLAVIDRTHPALPQLSFAEVAGKREVWEYAALVTSLHDEILTLGQLYRDRADCENGFDELKNQWGWGGFTTQDVKRCRLLARSVALIY